MDKDKLMAGLYLHIPFCKQACFYCGFHFSTLLSSRQGVLDAMMRELDLQRGFFDVLPPNGQVVDTIYFGGGTPSLLEEIELKEFMAKIGLLFRVGADCEITLEANPDDVTPRKLLSWRRAGVNRLSIGIQSFFAEDLSWMHRAHDAGQALACLRDIRDAGYDNFSADLIYGYPLLTDRKWTENIRRMLDFQVPHLSCYAMTVEDRTPLDSYIRNKRCAPMDEDQAATQFEMLMDTLATAGYEHYEISNFAKPGWRSRHNSHYWSHIPYLGIGPSAHSFRKGARRWNISNNAQYVKSIREEVVPFQQEELTPAMELNEYLMTSLRTMEGCDLVRVAGVWGPEESNRIKKESVPFLRDGRMILLEDRLVLSGKGKLFADGIASALFL